MYIFYLGIGVDGGNFGKVYQNKGRVARIAGCPADREFWEACLCEVCQKVSMPRAHHSDFNGLRGSGVPGRFQVAVDLGISVARLSVIPIPVCLVS